ncbi:hypothetical protein [uncultured Jatrophihabitans sp.]|uniref:hypothetical protein n=1 Tax=uncultured Jatrophihabitans sp. TaxID=1610747 RepID=UPI0035C9BC00
MAAERRKRLEHLERRVLEAEASVRSVRAELDRAKAALGDEQREGAHGKPARR